jgi:hypothetical protein
MAQYIRLATAPIDEVVTHILHHWTNNSAETKRVPVNGHPVGVVSLRLRTFGRMFKNTGKIHCVSCGLPAEFFAVEKFSRGVQPFAHANLYGTSDGKDVLFTHDHILARSLGGADNLSNTQVMCSPCNAKKGVYEQKLAKHRKQNGKANKGRTAEASGIGTSCC